MIMRRIARPMLAAVFVSGGIETLRNPKPRIQAAEPVVDRAVGQVQDKLPEQVPTDAETLVKIDAMVKIGAGVALALGRFPRLAAFLLAASLAPTTAAGHRFWEYEDPQERAAQRAQFLKNVSLLGGLLIAAGDTHGKPSVAWRARHAVDAATGRLQGSAADVTGSVRETANAAAGTVLGTAAAAAGKVQKLAGTASGKVQDVAGSVNRGVKMALPG